MADRSVDTGEAQAKPADLLAFVREGREVVISEGDEPVARLVPVRPGGCVAGLHRGAARMAADFDDPLPDSFWLAPPADRGR